MRVLLAITLGILLSSSAALAVSPTPPVLEGKDIRAALALANAWGLARDDVVSFVTTEAVTIVFPGETAVNVQLPDDEAYIAIAPYFRNTHPCATHYISSCVAELKNQEFYVNVSTAAGEVIFGDLVMSLPNGFVELWLPRHLDLLVTFELDGRLASGLISTRDGAPTCITTIRFP